MARKARETGYTHCACRDCFDVATATIGYPAPLCNDCKAADCDCDGKSECQRDDAYGEG